MLPLRSFSLPRVLLGTFAGVLLGGLGLGGCSSPQKPDTDPGAAPGVSLLDPVGNPTGGRVDSLNGIPGHPFGEPLSAFPGLRLCPAPDGNGDPRYWYFQETEKMGGWWGKQSRQKGGFINGFYSFAKGRFIGFQAVAGGTTAPKLLAEAQYLYGPGAADATGINWIGARSEARYQDNKGTGDPWLTVRTHDYRQQMAEVKAETQQKERAKAQAEVKAENAR